jgi:membrane associated rhomboid family serine protease
MGIYDRDYYRREGPGFLDSLGSRGRVCLWLIGINILVYIIQLMTRRPIVPAGVDPMYVRGLRMADPFTDALLLNVEAVWNGQVWRLLTYAFLHAPNDWMHVAFNMLFLYWFGSDVEDLYGPREFLAFYLTSALVGGIAFELGWLTGATPTATLCLGASGAVTAVMVLCACHYPTRIIYLFLMLPVPIWVFVLFQVGQDLFGFLGGGHGGTAVTVHLGGAAFGYLYHQFNWRVLGFLPSLGNWQRQRTRPRLRVYREEDAPAPMPAAAAPAETDADELLEAQLDAVLEKLHRFGKESLTEKENQILMRASEVARRRRT